MTEKAQLNIIQKLNKLRAKVPYIQKEQKQYMKFSVVSSETVLKEFWNHMNKLGILLKTDITEKTVERVEIGVNSKTDKKIHSYLVTLQLRYTWINVEDKNDCLTVDFIGIADDENSSYAFGQALTYAEKTFFLKEFNIPTDDMDPDTFQKEVLKRIPAQEEQIQSVYIQMDKLAEATGQPREAFLEQAKMTNNIGAAKKPDEFSAYDVGLMLNTLTKWVNGYEKKAQKEAKK